MIRFGDDNVTWIGGVTGWSTPSDKRIKRDIKENVPGLAFIKLLKPVTYHLNLDVSDAIIKRPGLKDKGGNIIPLSEEQILARSEKEKILYTGFLAQDVESAAKSIQYEFSGVTAPKNNNELYSLRYAEFVVPLVKAVQELNGTHDSMESQFRSLKVQIDSALSEIAKIRVLQAACCLDTVSATTSTSGNFLNVTKDNGSGDSYLEQNAPNPYSRSTIIRFYLPTNTTSGQVVITNQNGQVMKTYSVSGKKSGQLTVEGGEFTSGTYIYTLLINGQKVDSKRMIVTR